MEVTHNSQDSKILIFLRPTFISLPTFLTAFLISRANKKSVTELTRSKICNLFVTQFYFPSDFSHCFPYQPGKQKKSVLSVFFIFCSIAKSMNQTKPNYPLSLSLLLSLTLLVLTKEWYTGVLARIRINAFRIELAGGLYEDLLSSAAAAVESEGAVGNAVYMLPSFYNHDCGKSSHSSAVLGVCYT